MYIEKPAVLSAHETLLHTPYFDAAAPDGGNAVLIGKDGALMAVSRNKDGKLVKNPFTSAPDRLDGAQLLEENSPFLLEVFYLYRDMNNYKASGSACIGPFLPGVAKPESDDIQAGSRHIGLHELGRILTALSDGDGFIPSEIGMEDLQYIMVDGFNEEEDGVLHETIGFTLKPVTEGYIPAGQVLAAIDAWMARGREWDIGAALERL